MGVGELIKSTLPFFLLRLAVILIAYLCIVLFGVWGARALTLTFWGVPELSGVFGLVFYISYALVGVQIGLLIIPKIRDYILYAVKMAHVIAITRFRLEVEDTTVSKAISEVVTNFGRTSFFFVSDTLILKAVAEIKEAVISNEVLPFFNTEAADGGILDTIRDGALKFVSNTAETVFNMIDEVVFSYFYAITLIEEEAMPDTKVTKKHMFSIASDGICRYIGACKYFFRTTVFSYIACNVFSFVFVVLSMLYSYLYIDGGILTFIIIWFSRKFLYNLITFSVVEPLLVTKMINEFFDFLDEEEDDKDTISSIVDNLCRVSPSFRRVMKRAGYKPKDNGGAIVSGAAGAGVLGFNVAETMKDAFIGGMVGDESYLVNGMNTDDDIEEGDTDDSTGDNTDEEDEYNEEDYDDSVMEEGEADEGD